VTKPSYSLVFNKPDNILPLNMWPPGLCKLTILYRKIAFYKVICSKIHNLILIMCNSKLLEQFISNTMTKTQDDLIG
jgi:hypothetical protein